MLNGFYPRIYADKIPPECNSKNYIKTYVERDMRKIININNVHSFQTFIKLFAGRIGQILNINNLCNEIGILEASHLIYYNLFMKI